MERAEADAKSISNITEALSGLHERGKELRKQRDSLKKKVYDYMEKYDIEKINGHGRKYYYIKPKTIRKSEKQKCIDGINYFKHVLKVDNPEKAWEDFKRSQKVLDD